MRIISKRKSPNNNNSNNNNVNNLTDQQLPKNLQEKLVILQPYIDRNADFINRVFYIGKDRQIECRALYLEGVIDVNSFYEHVLESLMIKTTAIDFKEINQANILDNIYESYITVGKTCKISQTSQMINIIFDGMVVLIFAEINDALAIDIHGGMLRAIEEPPTERSLKGSREGFSENLDTNLGIIRRRLCDPRLIIQKTILGKRTRANLALVYIEDIADPAIVSQVQEKINKIDIDGILEVEEFMEEHPYSIFPQFWGTERSDKAIAQFLQGQIGIIVDGSPYAIFVPSLFVQFLMASEDYYERNIVATFMRFFKGLAFFLAISAPGIFVALVSFQQELIPVNLLIPLAMARNEVPFSVIAEALIQEGIIQLVIEAGMRMPGSIGQTVGVVAGIVLGQAAIEAKLASPSIIIIVAITAISTFALPSISLIHATRVIRLLFIAAAATFGLFGFSLAWLLLLIHLSSIENFGIPYFAPIAPTRYSDFKDILWRSRIPKMNKRSVSLQAQDKQRQGVTREESNQDV